MLNLALVVLLLISCAGPIAAAVPVARFALVRRKGNTRSLGYYTSGFL